MRGGPLRLGPRPRGVRREQAGPVTAGPETGGQGGPNAEKNKLQTETLPTPTFGHPSQEGIFLGAH